MKSRPDTVKLERHEWVNLVTAVVTKIGKGTAKGILRNALGEERANLLIEHQEGPRLSKDDNRAIIEELYPHIPVESRAAKKLWVLNIGKEVFGDTERFSEILDYVEHRVTEHEEAGGTIDHMPPTPDAEDEAFFRDLNWLRNDPSGRDAKVTRDLQLRNLSASQVVVDLPDISGWPDGPWGADTKAIMCAAVERDGAWYGGKFEHVRPGQGERGLGNIGGYLKISPKRGEPVRFWLLSYDGRQATNVVEDVWQKGTASEPEPESKPIFQWNGTNEFRLDPSLNAERLYITKHTGPDGKKYPWQGENAQYHELIEMHRPVPSNGVIAVRDPAAIAREGIVQVCHDNAGMRPISMCWLVRPRAPVESYITEAEWRAGKTDGVILPFGRNG